MGAELNSCTWLGSENRFHSVLLCVRTILPPSVLQTWNKVHSWHPPEGREVWSARLTRGNWHWVCRARSGGSQPRSPFNGHVFTAMEPPRKIARTREGALRAVRAPSLRCCFHFPLVNLATLASARRL